MRKKESQNVPLVSVIIPTYKRGHLLERAIKSVLNQTYTNIEIIVVDDNNPGSIFRSETIKVMEQFVNNNLIIYKKLKENRGGATARNEGLKLASGEFVCFLDDDDEFLEKKVELQIKKVLEADVELAVVGGFANIVNKNGETIRVEKNLNKGNVLIKQLANNICTTSIAMIRRDILNDIGGFDSIPSSQEHLLFIKIFLVNPFYDFTENVIVNINHHEGERISTNLNKPKGALLLFEYVKSIYSTLNIDEQKYINRCHYKNILQAYVSINDKKNAIKFLKKIIRHDKGIQYDTIKNIIKILLGPNISNWVIARKV